MLCRIRLTGAFRPPGPGWGAAPTFDPTALCYPDRRSVIVLIFIILSISRTKDSLFALLNAKTGCFATLSGSSVRVEAKTPVFREITEP